MCTRYEDFLVRLKEERVIRKWSQQQMGRKLRMTQSHYCKAELGVRRFTFYEMKCLCEAELDIYYIFTGRRCRPEYQEFYKDCTYEELKCYLAVLCPIAGYLQKKGRQALGADSCRKAESAPYSLASDKGEKTVFYHLRRWLDCSQQEMAERLDVDVKKLRNLENGNVYPDSELIWKVSEELGVPFSIILNDKNGLRGEVSYFAEMIAGGGRDKMMERLKAFYGLIRGKCQG